MDSILSTRLVDDVASHIRLFKKAKFAEKTQEGNGGKIVDLKSLFFDAEVAMETNLNTKLHTDVKWADFLSSKNDDWSLEVYGLHKRENSGLFFRRLDTWFSPPTTFSILKLLLAELTKNAYFLPHIWILVMTLFRNSDFGQ